MLALHVLFAAAVWWEMRPPAADAAMRAPAQRALQVRLIARSAAARPARPVPPPLRRPSVRPVHTPAHERMAKPAMTASLPPSAASNPPARPRLFDRTGQPLLPAVGGGVAAVPGYVQRMPQGDAQVMRHVRPLTYRATRLEKYFPPPDETLLGQTVRRVLGATHTGDHKQVDLPHGVHLQCRTLLGLPTPDCSMPPAPPSAKDGDERLSMAPAAPLSKALAPPKPSEAACIASYRAGKPLPYGCPVDTPARAVDAECVEQRHAGKPLAAHCRPDRVERSHQAVDH